jgi:hypothetical protein
LIELDGRDARFVLTRSFACSPEALFRWLTEPARIARWSAASVEMAGPFVAGAERIVTIRLGPLRVQRLVERIVAVEPAQGFSYLGASVPGHRGEVRMRRLGLGSELRWEACFQAPHALLAWPIARFVSQQMSQSFTRLEQQLAAAAALPAA